MSFEWGDYLKFAQSLVQGAKTAVGTEGPQSGSLQAPVHGEKP
jgi:hypothetical protein